MNSPIMQILEIAKDMSASEVEQAIQIMEARLKEVDSTWLQSKRHAAWDAKQLQAGLEEAVRREAKCEWCGKSYNPICPICNEREGRNKRIAGRTP